MSQRVHSLPASWVLLHGTPLRPSIWARTARSLRDQPVTVPDMHARPGQGCLQRSMAERLSSRLPTGRWDLVGHSFGGQVAIELALAVPHRVRTITVLCSRDTPFPAFTDLARDVVADRVPSVDQTLARWFTPDEVGRGGEAVRLARVALGEASRSPREWTEALTAIATYDRSRASHRLGRSATFVAERLDGVSTVDVMRELRGRVPGSLLVPEPGAHMSPFVDARRLARHLIRWRDLALRRVGGAPPA